MIEITIIPDYDRDEFIVILVTSSFFFEDWVGDEVRPVQEMHSQSAIRMQAFNDGTSDEYAAALLAMHLKFLGLV